MCGRVAQLDDVLCKWLFDLYRTGDAAPVQRHFVLQFAPVLIWSLMLHQRISMPAPGTADRLLLPSLSTPLSSHLLSFPPLPSPLLSSPLLPSLSHTHAHRHSGVHESDPLHGGGGAARGDRPSAASARRRAGLGQAVCVPQARQERVRPRVCACVRVCACGSAVAWDGCSLEERETQELRGHVQCEGRAETIMRIVAGGQSSVTWCGVVWCGVLLCGVMWCAVLCCCVVWCRVVWCGVVWSGVLLCGVMWCGHHLWWAVMSTGPTERTLSVTDLMIGLSTRKCVESADGDNL